MPIPLLIPLFATFLTTFSLINCYDLETNSCPNNLHGINASASSLLLTLVLVPVRGRDEMRSLYLKAPNNYYKSLFSIMDNGDGGRKLTGIRQIVRLKGILKRWRSVAVTSRSNTPVCSSHRKTQSTGSIYSMPKILNKRLESIKSFGDSDEDAGGGCQSPDMPLHVPKGYLAVYVGEELRRFLIPTDYLSHPLFKVILEKVEEEFGFDHSGGLTIPCEIETFKYLLQCMENQNKANHDNNHADHDNNAEAAA